MFDPESHFDSLARLVPSCKAQAHEVIFPDPKIDYDRFNKWTWAIWRIDIIFPDGCELNALESYAKRKNQELRKLQYRFCDSSKELIFRMDNHDKLAPFEVIPHLHLPNRNERVYDENRILKGHSLKDYDFRKVWDLVQTYFDGGVLPWL